MALICAFLESIVPCGWKTVYGKDEGKTVITGWKGAGILLRKPNFLNPEGYLLLELRRLGYVTQLDSSCLDHYLDSLMDIEFSIVKEFAQKRGCKSDQVADVYNFMEDRMRRIMI